MVDTQGGYSSSTTHLTWPITISPMLYIHLSIYLSIYQADKMGQYDATLPRNQLLSHSTIKKSTIFAMAPSAEPLW
jgi:hypothetical protein